MVEYYDGTRLLSTKDINGNRPEIFICTTNRTGGKTTYFNRLLINRFKKKNDKFMLLYRYRYELDNVSERFFKDIQGLFFKDDEMGEIKQGNGVFTELFLNDVSCGYAVALNTADTLKKYSHFFSDVEHILFDEFQSETNRYCSNEIEKFYSIHTSVARGQGKMNRYVPVYMISNPVSIINPYYTALGISARLDDKTRFLKGDGYVVEQGHIESAEKAQKESAFNRAFGKSHYSDYSAEGKYLNDNTSFIDKISGKSNYLMTLKFHGNNYGVRSFPEKGIIYCDDRPDESFPLKITVTTDDHEINYIMLRASSGHLAILRYYFEIGAFRFKNLNCKEAVISALAY